MEKVFLELTDLRGKPGISAIGPLLGNSVCAISESKLSIQIRELFLKIAFVSLLNQETPDEYGSTV